MSTPILGPAQATSEQACYWALGKGAESWYACDVVRMYWRFAAERGVRPEVAFAQSCHETGFGYVHTGPDSVLDASFNNFAGIKTPAGGDNQDPGAHTRFPTREVGVIAHIDHLALYAGAIGYPRTDTPDPRHFHNVTEWPHVDLTGKAPTVEELSGKWAKAPTYHTKIVTWVEEIRATST